MIKKSDKETEKNILLTPEQTEQFQTSVKIGLYKQLHQKGLLTDAQLEQLISFQNT